ncbi:hypothetical protein ACFPIJ_29165 [Dactylosporangium cerinum]|uniref:Uncharacterized protein n=1 Tax=Dactylosporangium cerinum TaxID=1434730 RepID=A0ABV9W0K6_9ACTN
MIGRLGRSRMPQRSARRAAVGRAGRLLDEGRTVDARSLLEATLPPQPPIGAAPDRWLIDAAVLWVHLTHDDPDTYPARLAWARYAYDASRALPGKPADLDRRQASTDAYADALYGLDRHDEAFAVSREGIDLAFARGDIDDVVDRRILLAAEEHERRCDEASHDALAALAERHARHPDTSISRLVQTLPILLGLETCHRHDQAETVAANLRITDLADTDQLDALLDSIESDTGIGVQHTARVHAEAVCDHGDCPVPDPTGDTPPAERQRAMTARLFGLILAGYDPTNAAAHPALITVAARYTAVADPHPDRCTVTPLDWAHYAHDAVLHLPGIDCAQAVAATRTAAGTFQRLSQPQEADRAWQRLAEYTDHLDGGNPDDAVTCRMAIAEEHYRHGRCDAALATATAAVTAWRTRQHRNTLAGTVAVVRARLLFDGCHRHHEYPDSDPVSLFAFSDRDTATALTLHCHGLTVMAEHARRYHPDDACTDQACRQTLAIADDIARRRRGPVWLDLLP